MKRLTAVSAFLLLCSTLRVSAQQAQGSKDPYKAVLDRLQSITIVRLSEWRFHSDVPHPEDPSLNDQDWQVMKAEEKWTAGPRVLRRWIEVPEKIAGYTIQGARGKLDIFFHSKESEEITIFSN